MAIDWMNPTAEMLAGLEAGRQEATLELEESDAHIAELQHQLAGVVEVLRHLAPHRYQGPWSNELDRKLQVALGMKKILPERH